MDKENRQNSSKEVGLIDSGDQLNLVDIYSMLYDREIYIFFMYVEYCLRLLL